ncbi:MAG: HAD-IC family P-type ATPase [Solirubrobacteraceae bacterium]
MASVQRTPAGESKRFVDRPGAGSPLPAGPSAGLSEAEAKRRLAERGGASEIGGSRSYASIVRANVFTVFNLILACFGTITLIFGDWRDALFLGVLVANTAIGITQEVRAKRALDRLALLVAPHATVLRDGSTRSVAATEVVEGDLVAVQAGDQIVADGQLSRAVDLRLDESILTGESDSVPRATGEQLRSGAFVAEGSGSYRVTAVGAGSYAGRLLGEARSFRHPRSPLEQAVNRLLICLVALVVLLGAVLGYSLWHRHTPLHEAVATATAGVVSLVPEGLVVLISLAYAVASIRMARRGVLSQQLNAIESLASVDVICLDKTGTLTEAALRVAAATPAEGVTDLDRQLGRYGASSSLRNGTVEAIADAYPSDRATAIAEVPFNSRRKWSAVQLADATLVLGAPEHFALGELSASAERERQAGRRVLALARSTSDLAAVDPDAGVPPCSVIGLLVLGERLRPQIRETIAFFRSEGVDLKVLSGDNPQTVAAIAADVGIEIRKTTDGASLPADPEALRRLALETTVIGRITPEGKRAVVESLRDAGRYVAMVGDGVNDVPALKASRLAIAQGTGTQMAKAVADLVLIDGDFGAVPELVHQGRQALRNLQRVARLYLTKSSFAAFLILVIGTTSTAYPLLPRHLSLAAAIAIGIPTFFLALAPSSGPWQPAGFGRQATRFALPAGMIIGVGVVASYLFALHDLGYAVREARVVATTVLVITGLYLVYEIEGGSLRRRTAVGAMCLVLFGLYVAAIVLPPTRHFFALEVPNPGMAITALLGSALAIVALYLSGYPASSSADGGTSQTQPDYSDSTATSSRGER